jgi:hypothetical protein
VHLFKTSFRSINQSFFKSPHLRRYIVNHNPRQSLLAGPATRRRLPGAAVALAALALVAVAAPVFAASPTNDLPSGAIAIETALPQVFDQDTTEATVTTDDFGCGAGGLDAASVWYSFTPTEDMFVLVSAANSDYLVGINVFAGAADAESLIDCGDVFLGLSAQAGTTYYLMLADVEGGAPFGGNLHLEISLPPPPIEVGLTVDATGSVNTKTGVATLHGTVECTAVLANAEITVELVQTAGRFTIHGAGDGVASCSERPTAWAVEVNGDNGKFGGGKVAVVASAFACDEFSCGGDEFATDARLRR